MHSEPIMRDRFELTPSKFRSVFTKGGFAYYSPECMEGAETSYAEKSVYENRLGFYGWGGLGGSVF